MGIHITALNNDTSYLITCSPSTSPADPAAVRILLDPWVTASAAEIFSVYFSSQIRPTEAWIDSLKRLVPEPQYVLISQVNPDHCHEESLKSLGADTKAVIVAPGSVTRRIKGWRYFEERHVRTIEPYVGHRVNSFRIKLPGHDHEDKCSFNDGYLDIALLVEKGDLMGMHNAFGITYKAAGSVDQQEYAILYAPHGSSVDTVQQWKLPRRSVASGIGSDRAALDVMLHPLNHVTGLFNMTYVYGAEGYGVQVAKTYRPDTWIVTHDEEKVLSGVGTMGITLKVHEQCDVEKRFDEPSPVIIKLALGQTWTLNKIEQDNVL